MHPDFIAKRMVTERGGAIFSRKTFPGVHVSRVEFSRGAENGSSFFMPFYISLQHLTIRPETDPILDKEKTLCPT
mgnify:CR=1 FL=1